MADPALILILINRGEVDLQTQLMRLKQQVFYYRA